MLRCRNTQEPRQTTALPTLTQSLQRERVHSARHHRRVWARPHRLSQPKQPSFHRFPLRRPRRLRSRQLRSRQLQRPNETRAEESLATADSDAPVRCKHISNASIERCKAVRLSASLSSANDCSAKPMNATPSLKNTVGCTIKPFGTTEDHECRCARRTRSAQRRALTGVGVPCSSQRLRAAA